MFLKSTLIGTSTFVGTFRVDMGTGITTLVLTYLLGLGRHLRCGRSIINALAPTFGGQKDSVQALKTAAYAATAAWVGGVAQLIPWLGWLIGLAAAVYSIYLLFLGLPHTMKAPADKRRRIHRGHHHRRHRPRLDPVGDHLEHHRPRHVGRLWRSRP